MEETPKPQINFCPHCGFDIRSLQSAMFCPNCGKQINDKSNNNKPSSAIQPPKTPPQLPPKNPQPKPKKRSKKWILWMIIGIVFGVPDITCRIIGFAMPKYETYETLDDYSGEKTYKEQLNYGKYFLIGGGVVGAGVGALVKNCSGKDEPCTTVDTVPPFNPRTKTNGENESEGGETSKEQDSINEIINKELDSIIRQDSLNGLFD